MKSAHWRIAVPIAALFASAAVPAAAQRPLSPAEQAMILEQRVNATQSSLLRIEQRLEALERQLQQIVNHSEVNAHRLGTLEADLRTLRGDVTSRMSALESRPVAASASAGVASEEVESPQPKPKLQTASTPIVERPAVSASVGESADPGEDAYSIGFRLWDQGKYDQAITALRAFTSAFPNHRRVSFANNLIGRALLDKGQPRPAAEALLANYRSNPKGERAPDSLYYLGQSLMKLEQPSQACKAYAELEAVYGPSVRSDLRSLVTKGKADARCS